MLNEREAVLSTIYLKNNSRASRQCMLSHPSSGLTRLYPQTPLLDLTKFYPQSLSRVLCDSKEDSGQVHKLGISLIY